MRPSFTLWRGFAHTIRTLIARAQSRTCRQRADATLIARRMARSATPRDRSASYDRREQVVALAADAQLSRRRPAAGSRRSPRRRRPVRRRSRRSSCKPHAPTLAPWRYRRQAWTARASIRCPCAPISACCPATTRRRSTPTVRLNTNESPFAPPAAWLAEYLDAVATLAWNRYPDRRASALRAAIAGFHGVPAEQVFAANGSNEVIQSLLLAYAGAGRIRRRVRADVPAARPHRPDHRRHRRRR